MLEKCTLNSMATALLDIVVVSMPIARSLKTRHLWHCVV
jgi:recombinational DNA repair protein RecT